MSHDVAASPRSGLCPTRVTLGNGLTVLAKRTTKTPAVTMSLALRVGSICDADRSPGECYLLSRVIDRGTATRSAADIAEALDARGTSLTATVTRHLLTLALTCLAEDFEAMLALMGDIVMHPAVPAHELDVRKREVVTAIRQDLDNPAVQAAEGLMALLYGESHPYGRHVKGSIASVELMDAATLCDFHARHCAPSLATLVVVGDVDVEQVAACAHTVFSGWNTAPPREVVVAPPVMSCERRTRVISMMNKSQADIAYGFTTIARSDPDYDTFWLMNNVLGQYALGGRLGDNIRERQGMAYYVSSTFDPDIVAGPLAIRAGVNAANVTRTVQAIDEEITSLVATGVTEKELAESRQYLIGSLPRALETNAGIAQFLQTVECFGLGLDYDIQLPARLGRVTRDGIADVARRYLDPSRAAVVIAGPYQA